MSKTLKRVLTLSVVLAALLLGHGCNSSGTTSSMHVSYGVGFHSGGFYNPWYGGRPIVVPPPRPPRPPKPPRPPRPTPMPRR